MRLLMLFGVMVHLVLSGVSYAERETVDVRKVGMTVSLTGPLAQSGREQLHGVQMWIQDLNERGGLFSDRVELVYYDDQSDRMQVAPLYEKLITEDQVEFLLGPVSTALTYPAAFVAEEHDMPMIAVLASADKIWEVGFRNIFGIVTPASTEMELILGYAAGKELKTVAQIYANNDATRLAAKGVRNRAAKHGLELVFDQQYNAEQVDFAELVRQIAPKNPDIVFMAGYLGAADFVREAKRAGLQPKIMAISGAAAQGFGDELGADADGVMATITWIHSAHIPGAYDFSFRYREQHGYYPDVYAATAYSAGQVIEAAVRLAGTTDRFRVRRQLEEMRFTSLIGHYRVNREGKQIGKPDYVLQWQDEQRRLVLPRDLARYELLFPYSSPAATR